MSAKDQLKELEAKVNLGLKESFRKLVEFKKLKNSPIVISRNGVVTTISADKIILIMDDKN